MKIELSTFGKTVDGQEVKQFILQNTSGMKVTLTNYGAILTSLSVPDRNGDFEDVVLGFPTLEGY
jgi:aldose 1-epimerase